LGGICHPGLDLYITNGMAQILGLTGNSEVGGSLVDGGGGLGHLQSIIQGEGTDVRRRVVPFDRVSLNRSQGNSRKCMGDDWFGELRKRVGKFQGCRTTVGRDFISLLFPLLKSIHSVQRCVFPNWVISRVLKTIGARGQKRS